MLEWIHNVDITSTPEKKPYINIDEEDYCLIFNYTVCTITLYRKIEISNLDKFCFIHGNCKSEHIVIGHNSPINSPEYELYSPIIFEDDLMFNNPQNERPENMIKRLIDMTNQILYKDPNHNIDQKIGFFQDIAKVDEIIILGWSLGNNDIPYMDKVMDVVRKNVKITIVYYGNDTKLNYETYFKARAIRNDNVYYMSWDEYARNNRKTP